MTVPSERLNSQATNREVGFFPSESVLIVNSSTDYNVNLHPFMWIEAYFDSTEVTAPIVAVWDGVSYFDAPTNTVKLVNPVKFAYSGNMKPTRGIQIVTTGKDYRGNTINSITTGQGADFSQLIVSGGARPAA